MAGLYIHIPLCTKRCSYCSFFSSTLIGRRAEIIDALCREMRERKGYLPADDNVLSTIYIGGGTPSLLPMSDIERLIDNALDTFDHAEDMEITMEANPDDLSDDYVKGMAESRINRLSIGVQTFDDEELKLINRRHDSAEAVEAIERVKRAGIDNFGMDLIFGLPSQTSESFERTIDKAISLAPAHISAYSLELQEDSLLFKKVEKGEVLLPSDEEVEQMSEQIADRLQEAGYEHYEISNWAKPGRRSRHNSSYWTGTPYLGVGPSAHSFDGESREWNVSNVLKYLGGAKPEKEILSEQDKYNEYLFLSLRTCEGICFADYEARYGSSRLDKLESEMRQFLNRGLMSFENGHLRLTRKGIILSNTIISELFEVD
ncbi:MAG: radical SAM family heme chaperone HemW [Paludibacteraceae bacterium]|nr:radical SAM family heme chaperone HemW [Paludibacteraceae bacterium]